MRNSDALAPLRRPVFRRLATSYAVNELGDWMGIVALSVLVYEKTGSAMATAVLFLGTSFLPAVFAPMLVARAEKPPPRFVLPVLYAGEAAVFTGLALLSTHFSLWAVFLLATLDGIFAITGRALTRAVAVALLEPAGELRAGNGILNVAFTVGSAAGPAIAGLVVAGFGVQTALLLDAVSFCAIGWILLTAGHLPRATPDPGDTLERLRAGFAYIGAQVKLRRLLVAQGAAFIFFAAVLPVEVVYAKESLGAGDTGYGLLLTSWGVGMVAGSFVFVGLRKASLPFQLFFSTLVVAAGYLGMAFAPELSVACAAAALGGAGNGVQWVAVVSSVQELTIQNMQARVMSVLESIGSAMPGVGFLAGGLIATGHDPRATFLVAGLGIVAIVLVTAPLLGKNWPEEKGFARLKDLDSDDEVVVELIPVLAPPIQSGTEVLR